MAEEKKQDSTLRNIFLIFVGIIVIAIGGVMILGENTTEGILLILSGLASIVLAILFFTNVI